MSFGLALLYLELGAYEFIIATQFSIPFLFFLGNFAGWRSTSFFDVDLLHLPNLPLSFMSLCVQFFISYLFLHFAVRKIHSNYLCLFLFFIAVGVLVSFGLNFHYVPIKANASFYLLPTRAWEFLVGAMVPFLVYPFVNSTLVKKPQFKAPGIIGCFAILSSLFFYTLPIGSHPILAQSVVVILTAVILGFGQTLSDRSIFSSALPEKNSAFLCYACSYLLVQSLLLGVWAFLIWRKLLSSM